MGKYFAVAELVIKSIYNGESLEISLNNNNIQPQPFFQELTANAALQMDYLRAQAYRAELQVDEIIKIADTELDPNRARVRIDARKWVASKMKPEKYGERIDFNINHTVDIAGAIEAAKQRILPRYDLNQLNITQSSEDTEVLTIETTGSKPVELPEEARAPVKSAKKSSESIFD